MLILIYSYSKKKMDQYVVMDNIINSWIKDNDAWNKFDSEKPQLNTVNKCAKHVHDTLMKIYPSVNMNNLELKLLLQ